VGWRGWRSQPAVARVGQKEVKMIKAKNHGGPLFDFADMPPIGLRVKNRRNGFLTLEAVDPYTRKDGTASHLLRWRSDDGREATSGLRAKSVTWVRAKETRT
jgi:hypothetical protein